MVWLKNLLELLFTLAQILDELSSRFGRFLDDLFSSLGNPVGMATAILTFASSVPGIILSKVGTSYFGLAATAFEKSETSDIEALGRPYQHVMTPSNACKWVQACFDDFIRTVTFTDERGIAETILGAMGGWLWRMFSGSKLRYLLKLIKISDEAEFVDFFTKKLVDVLGSVVFRVILAIVAAVLTLGIATAGQCFFIGSTMISPRRWEEFVLFSQHQRKREKTRIYRRVGGVKP